MLRIALLAALLLSTSCYKMKPDADSVNSTTSPAETAIATINSLANDSEAIGFTFDDQMRTDDVEGFMAPACKPSQAKSDCNSNNQIAVNWGECSAANGAKLSGGWTNTYSNTNACRRAKVGPLQSGDSVTRTSSGMSIDGLYGGRVTWSTNVHLTYDNTTILGTGLTVSKINDTRILTIGGLHRILENSKGSAIYDHSLVGLSQLTMTGQRSNGTRNLHSGVVRVFSNTERQRSDITFSGVIWGNANCCYPTAGEITTVTTSATKNETTTLRFDRATCGQASLENGTKSTAITLQQCE